MVRPPCILRGCADGQPPALGLSQAPIAAISGLTARTPAPCQLVTHALQQETWTDCRSVTMQSVPRTVGRHALRNFYAA